MSTRTRFEKEAKGNSEMAYWSNIEDQARSERTLDGLSQPQIQLRLQKYDLCATVVRDLWKILYRYED